MPAPQRELHAGFHIRIGLDERARRLLVRHLQQIQTALAVGERARFDHAAADAGGAQIFAVRRQRALAFPEVGVLYEDGESHARSSMRPSSPAITSRQGAPPLVPDCNRAEARGLRSRRSTTRRTIRAPWRGSMASSAMRSSAAGL